jgi:hypothetical protein
MSTIQKKDLLDPHIIKILKNHKDTEKQIEKLQLQLYFLKKDTPSLHDKVVSLLQTDLQQISDLQYYSHTAFCASIAGKPIPPYDEYKQQLHLQCIEKYILMHLVRELSVELFMINNIVQINCYNLKENKTVLLQCQYDTLVDLITSYQDTIRIKKGKLFSSFIVKNHSPETPSLGTSSSDKVLISVYNNIFTPENWG